ncbi:MAG: type I-D CRISPR-associated protein Cas7/Csc2 [bacterium]
MNSFAFLEDPSILSQGNYFQIVTRIKLLDETIIRSNDAEEVLTFHYKTLGNRFIIPWRKVKGKLRRLVQEQQRGLGVHPECHLKDDLCMKCPTCFMFGGTGETSNVNVKYNILSRILGETFISETEVGDVTSLTENAVDEETLTTGQALMSIITVPKETNFLGVITLKDPTKEMAQIILDNLNRLTRIGARSVEWGRCTTEIIGIRTGDRETLTAYDLVGKKVTDIPDLKNVSDFELPETKDALPKLKKQVEEKLSQLQK